MIFTIKRKAKTVDGSSSPCVGEWRSSRQCLSWGSSAELIPILPLLWVLLLLAFLIGEWYQATSERNFLAHASGPFASIRSEEHTSELQSRGHLVCRLLLEKKKKHAEMIVNIEQASAA